VTVLPPEIQHQYGVIFRLHFWRDSSNGGFALVI
jgi:hypothetical protein